MLHAFKIGVSFGSTSGVITTLGLMVGLYSSTGSKLTVIGGILIIAIADSFSDALGIHMSEESESKHTPKQIWAATIFTFLAKFIVSATFIIPVLLLPLSTAVSASVVWGLSLLTVFSWYLAKEQKEPAWKIILEHLLIAIVVVVLTHFVGDWVKALCGELS